MELNHQRRGILIGKLAKQTTRLNTTPVKKNTCNTSYQYFQSAPRKTGPLAECQGGRGCGCTRPCIGLCRGFLEATGLQCLPPETRWPLVSFVICFNWFFYKFQTTQKAKWKLGRSNYLNIAKGTTDPRVKFILQDLSTQFTDILNILQFQNLG